MLALGVSQRDVPLVRAMIQMAHSLNMRVVAEGIESESILGQLQQLGCDEGQGYWWSAAQPLAQWLDYVQKHGESHPAGAVL